MAGEWNHVDIDATRLAWQDRGEGEPVLLLHPGFLADGMLPLMGRPELAGFRLIASHRRGYGASSRAEGPLEVTRHALDVVALLERIGVARAHLVGHSLGANVALQVAVTAPERVGALVVMEPLLGFALAPETAAYVGATAGQAMPLFAAGDHEGALDSWLLGAFGPGYRAELDRALPGAWSTAVVDAPTVFGGEVPALQHWAFDLEDLAQIQAPTLSVVSSAAYWAGFRETHEQLVSRIADCEGTTVPVPSHLLQIADPQAVAEPVAGFLRRHPLT